jgi:hypothetical protein
MPKVLDRGKARPTTEECELEISLGLSGELKSDSSNGNNALRSRTSERSDDSNETVVYRRKKNRSIEELVAGSKKAKNGFKKLEHRDDSGSSEGRTEREPAIFSGTRRVRSAFEAQFSGNTQAIVDNLEYLLEGLESANDESLRKAACEELLHTIEDARYFSVFKAHGFVEIALNRLLTEQFGHPMNIVNAGVGLLNKLSELEHDAIWLAEWIINPPNRSGAFNLFRSGLTHDIPQAQESSRQENDTILPVCSQVTSVGHRGGERGGDRDRWRFSIGVLS